MPSFHVAAYPGVTAKKRACHSDSIHARKSRLSSAADTFPVAAPDPRLLHTSVDDISALLSIAVVEVPAHDDGAVRKGKPPFVGAADANGVTVLLAQLLAAPTPKLKPSAACAGA